MARDISLLQNVQTDSGAQPASYSICTGLFSKCTAGEVLSYHSPPPNAAVKNEWQYTSPSACVSGIDREYFMI
jgi:hypothetical protein